MKQSIWENYNKDEINEKIRYWVDAWEDIIENFNENSFGLILSNPQLVISDIIDEINFNQMRKKSSKNYFIEQINEIVKNDETIKNYFITEFKLLKKYLGINNSFLSIEVCKKIFKIFKKGDYFERTFQDLKKIFTNNIWENGEEEKIRYFNQVLIVEFLLKGYDLSSIKLFPRNIFDKYTIKTIDEDKKFLYTKFPHKIKYKDYEKNDGFVDYKLYDDAIMNLINSLTIENRLNAFLDYFKIEPENRFFIFQIEGLRGVVPELQLGEVNIYNPWMKKKIKDSYERDSEYFERDAGKNFLNACVKIKSLDDEKSKEMAIELIEKVFDILRLYYKKYNSNFKVITESYIILDENYRVIGSRLGRDKKITDLEYYFFIDLNEIKLTQKSESYKYFNEYCKIVHRDFNDLNNIEKKMMYSLHWYRKAEESTNYEDQLLNYWISFESVFTEDFENEETIDKKSLFTIINENFPPVEVSKYIFNILKEIFFYVSNFYFSHRELLNIPEKVIKDSKIDSPPGSKINLKDFLDSIQDLIDAIEFKLIKEKLCFVKKLFSDNNFLKEHIKKQIINIENDLFLIYRLRNKIVHKAHYDNKILPYYIRKIEKYSRMLLIEISEKYTENQKLNLKEIILNSHIKIEILLDKIKNSLNIDLFSELS